jgi:cytosine/adenosine deaminase-related metal-dependent hydrolase
MPPAVFLRAPLVVLDPDHVVEDGALMIRAGRVVAAGPARRLARRFRARPRDLGDVVLAPGLVNAHAHLELSALRGRLPPTDRFVDWIVAQLDLIADWSPADFVRSYRLGARLSLAAGTAAVGDICRRRSLLREALRNPFRTVHHIEVIEPDPGDAGIAPAVLDIAHAVSETEAALRKVKRGARVRPGIAPHAPYTVSGKLYRALMDRLERGWAVQTHLAESRPERQFLKDGHGPFRDLLAGFGRPLPFEIPPGVSPVAYLDRLGVLRPPLVAVHCNDATRADVATLARRRVAVVFCPRSHAFFRRPPHPVRAMLRADVPVALGTDSLASNEDLDVRAEMREAVDRHGVDPNEAWRMATVHGAKALGLGRGAGTLRPGAPADMTAFSRIECASRRDALERLLDPACGVAAVRIGGESIPAGAGFRPRPL